MSWNKKAFCYYTYKWFTFIRQETSSNDFTKILSVSDSEDGGIPSGAELQAYRSDNFAFADGRKISEIEHLKVIDMYQFKHIT